jgi:hypothetical protein
MSNSKPNQTSNLTPEDNFNLQYICKNCNSCKTDKFMNIIRHLKTRTKCERNKKVESLQYSRDQLLVLSLLPYENNIHILSTNEIEELKSKNTLVSKKNELFSIVEDINKRKLKVCIYCNTNCKNPIDLRKHLLLGCYIEHNKDLPIITNNTISESYNTNTTNNNTNITNNIPITITNNINLQVKPPISFYEDWNISDIKDKAEIIFSNFMYTDLLKEILKNDSNLNVILEDKNDETGFVYKDEVNKYIKMKVQDIVDTTMTKLNHHLSQFVCDKSGKLIQKYLDEVKNEIDKKLDDYKTNKTINTGVKSVISDIYEQKKDEAVKITKSDSPPETLPEIQIKGF